MGVVWREGGGGGCQMRSCSELRAALARSHPCRRCHEPWKDSCKILYTTSCLYSGEKVSRVQTAKSKEGYNSGKGAQRGAFEPFRRALCASDCRTEANARTRARTKTLATKRIALHDAPRKIQQPSRLRPRLRPSAVTLGEGRCVEGGGNPTRG